MKEYLLYATGSAKPIGNASITYFVTADPEPLMKYFVLGMVIGILISTITYIILINEKARKSR